MVAKKVSRHYKSHEWRWLGWAGVVALVVLAWGLHNALVKKEQEPDTPYVILLQSKR